MRRLLVVAGLVILLAGVATAVYVSKHRFGHNVKGSSSQYVSTQTARPPKPGVIASPMFGGGPQHLHVAAGRLRPPFRLDWRAGGASLIEFPPAVGFHYLYYADGAGRFIALSIRNGRRFWTRHVNRCQAASPALDHLDHGTVYETFLNRMPCPKVVTDGEVVAVATGTGKLRWLRRIGASETSPTIVGQRLYVGDWEGNVHCLRVSDGKTIWTFHSGGAVKGAITYDRGRVVFGAYDGYVYELNARTGKLIWRSASDRDLFGGHGTFYSTAAAAYSRVYIGSTDGNVYSFGERNGKLIWSYGTGGYVYGSPAVWHGLVFVGSYNGTFYAFNAATGAVRWTFRANGAISGSATIVDGIVYFATLKRRTYGLDALTGREVWSYPDGGFTPVVTDGKRLYLVGWAKIYAFSPRRRTR